MKIDTWADQRHPVTKRLRTKPRPQLLVATILMAAAFPIRFEIGSGRTASLFDVAVIIAALVLVGRVAMGSAPNLPRPIFALGIVSIFLSFFSVLWSAQITESLLYGVASAEALVVLTVVLYQLQDAPSTQVIRLILFWIALLLVGAALLWARIPGFMPPSNLDPLSGDYISYFARLSHPFIGRSNNLAALLSIFIIPLAAVSWKTGNRLAGLASVVAAGATVLTFSRGSLIALACGVVLYLVVDGEAGRKLLKRMVGPFVLIVISVAAVFALNETASKFVGSRFSIDGYSSRLDLAQIATDIFERHWFLGVGAGVGDDVHNTYLQQLIYFGLFAGVVVSVLLLRVVFWWFTRERNESQWLATAIGVGFAVQMSSFLVQSSYEGALLRPLIWLSWALLIALYYARVQEQRLSEGSVSSLSSKR